MTDTKPKQRKQYIDTNPVESFRDAGKSVGQSIAQDFLKDTTTSMWDQFLGLGEYKPAEKKSGDLNPGEEIDLSPKQPEQPKNLDIAPGIDYRREIIHAEKKVIVENAQVIQAKIEQVLTEIRRLIASSQEIEVQYRGLVVQEAPQEAGEYHIAFFEWVLTVIKSARIRVEDSASWLSMFTSKKNKKQYWKMFKKHGTTFGLSNERVVSTQTG